MEIKLKKLSIDAVTPRYATDGAGCFDISTTTDDVVIPARGSYKFHTGLSFEIPQDHVMLVFSRSGHGINSDTRLANCVGVIDSDYRGELMIKLTNDSNDKQLAVEKYDRIAQAMVIPLPKVTFVEVDELGDTKRGTKGLGSTGTAA